MSVHIEVISSLGVSVDERISSMSSAEGNIRSSGGVIGYGWLEDLSVEESCCYLVALINELDKKNEGKYNDEWCKEVDRKWSKLAEYNQAIQGLRFPVGRFENGDMFWGDMTRHRLREDAVRFLLYYRSGCRILWDGKEQIRGSDDIPVCL